MRLCSARLFPNILLFKWLLFHKQMRGLSPRVVAKDFDAGSRPARPLGHSERKQEIAESAKTL